MPVFPVLIEHKILSREAKEWNLRRWYRYARLMTRERWSASAKTNVFKSTYHVYEYIVRKSGELLNICSANLRGYAYISGVNPIRFSRSVVRWRWGTYGKQNPLKLKGICNQYSELSLFCPDKLPQPKTGKQARWKFRGEGKLRRKK